MTKYLIIIFCLDDSSLRYIFRQQITDLILRNRDEIFKIGSCKDYTVNVYAHILDVFENLKHFSVIETFNMSYPALALSNLPSTMFSSSTLTQLCIDVFTLDDCLYLLYGRLKQLTTLIIRIRFAYDSSTIVHKMVGLNKFSLAEVRN